MIKSGYRFSLAILILVVALGFSLVSLAADTSSGPGLYQMPSEQSSDSPRDTLLYSDDFSAETSGWKISSSPVESFAYEDGNYKITTKEHDTVSVAYIPGGKIFSDFIVEVNISFEQFKAGEEAENAAGLELRRTEDDDCYYFEIEPYGDYTFCKYANGRTEDIIRWAESDAINPGLATNTLKIVCIGDEFTLYVNGIEVGSCRDSSLSSGEIGLFTETWDSSSLKASFDDLKVWGISSTSDHP